jgi:hypothetical protein
MGPIGFRYEARALGSCWILATNPIRSGPSEAVAPRCGALPTASGMSKRQLRPRNAGTNVTNPQVGPDPEYEECACDRSSALHTWQSSSNALAIVNLESATGCNAYSVVSTSQGANQVARA